MAEHATTHIRPDKDTPVMEPVEDRGERAEKWRKEAREQNICTFSSATFSCNHIWLAESHKISANDM